MLRYDSLSLTQGSAHSGSVGSSKKQVPRQDQSRKTLDAGDACEGQREEVGRVSDHSALLRKSQLTDG